MCKKWLRKNASFVVAVLLLGVLVGSVTGCVAESHEPYTQNYSALTTATDFSLGGEDRYFDKLQKDEENVLLFWGSWCPHCESLIERIDQLDSADAIKKNLFTVAEDESLDDVEGHKGDFPIYLDQDKSVYEAYGLEHIPTVFILNDQGESSWLSARGRRFSGVAPRICLLQPVSTSTQGRKEWTIAGIIGQ